MSETKHVFTRPGNGTIIAIYSDFENKFLSQKKVEVVLSQEELIGTLCNEEFKEKIEQDLNFYEYAVTLFIKSIRLLVTSKETLLIILKNIRKQQKNENTRMTYELVLTSYKFFLFKRHV